MAKPRSSEKRNKIFQAGLRLFAQNGYSKTTIKDIAAEANVSFGTVFTYFENKEELFHLCVTEPIEEFRNYLLETSGILENFSLNKLKEIVDEHVAYFLEKEDYLRVIQYVIGQPERFPEMMEELDQFSDEFMSFIQDIVKTGMEKGVLPEGNPEEVGYGYLAFLMGARLTFTDHANVQLTNAFKNQALRLFGIVV
ncbi:TetR/AcrR family transcriptional regulator [Virgibacillus litoralis]|uniref:AcrR family transcriptional regulator n=1 Tax=Virgibacillus litoralis TaxID=578221 RepID=A0ABS4HFR7_9BACI|nr:TetR/AcrR family transcriptional regulator [Virgibacillus litoralis]MBP1949673.1 AcrR family transcriptional regulator [Virgibacillus litoralis]